MFNSRDVLLAISALVCAGWVSAQTVNSYAGIGRAATTKEVAAWDIDVRPDFKGLPKGSGSVTRGQDVWESKCASCHGVFGESNEVFSPLIGGTTADDVKTGRVAKLLDPTTSRTTLMKLATVSTLWDYINRAMPWNQPKSLTTEEVYAVTAFLLNLGGVVPDDYTLSDKNIAEVQARMPNRDGMTTRHAMWPGNEFNGTRQPDVRNTACMQNCATGPSVTSILPGFARNAHGNLAEQNRVVGAQLGADTSRPEGQKGVAPAVKIPAAPAMPTALSLAQKNNCTACHAVDKKILGPSFVEIAKKYAGQTAYLADKIKAGGSGVWGPIPMPAQTLNDADANAIAVWLATGANR
jgi:cytochrome c